ncbi:MAG: HAD-IA family hydrolase [Deltaproteobacteria bacterium]|jgi:HAD superfamily hydrolase (TIGR01509 family)|nr:HAD-IA family hydrolase [Deltaproteobacteria bacterium]
MISAAFFDFDMTIVDSEESLVKTMNLFAADKGLRPITREDLMASIGCTLQESWIRYWGRCEPDWPDYYKERYGFAELSGIRPFPDTIPLLGRLREAGVKTAVVTNRWKAPLAVELAGLGGRFDAVVGAEEAERPKPHPDPVLKALELLRVPAGEALLVGDSDVDILASVAAGVKAVGVPTGAKSAEELTAAGAWRIIGRLGEFAGLAGL